MKKVAFILASFCMILSLNLSAQQQRGGQRMDPEARMKQTLETLKKELTLNDDQTKKIETILKDTQKKREGMFQNNQGGDREKMRADMQKMQNDEDAAIKKELTEEQSKKYVAWQEKRQKEMQERMQQMQGGRQGQGQGQGQGRQR